jgi:hypothetical protein
MQTNAAIIESLGKADAASGAQSTRPQIALYLTFAFLAVYVVMGCAISWSIFTNGSSVKDIALTVAAYLGLPLTVIKMYFGDLRKEHAQNKGQQVDFGVLGNIFGAKK